MRYFLLEQDNGYANVPRPVNWFGKLLPGKVMESLRKIPDREIFRIETGKTQFLLTIWQTLLLWCLMK